MQREIQNAPFEEEKGTKKFSIGAQADEKLKGLMLNRIKRGVTSRQDPSQLILKGKV